MKRVLFSGFLLVLCWLFADFLVLADSDRAANDSADVTIIGERQVGESGSGLRIIRSPNRLIPARPGFRGEAGSGRARPVRRVGPARKRVIRRPIREAGSGRIRIRVPEAGSGRIRIRIPEAGSGIGFPEAGSAIRLLRFKINGEDETQKYFHVHNDKLYYDGKLYYKDDETSDDQSDDTVAALIYITPIGGGIDIPQDGGVEVADAAVPILQDESFLLGLFAPIAVFMLIAWLLSYIFETGIFSLVAETAKARVRRADL